MVAMEGGLISTPQSARLGGKPSLSGASSRPSLAGSRPPTGSPHDDRVGWLDAAPAWEHGQTYMECGGTHTAGLTNNLTSTTPAYGRVPDGLGGNLTSTAPAGIVPAMGRRPSSTSPGGGGRRCSGSSPTGPAMSAHSTPTVPGTDLGIPPPTPRAAQHVSTGQLQRGHSVRSLADADVRKLAVPPTGTPQMPGSYPQRMLPPTATGAEVTASAATTVLPPTAAAVEGQIPTASLVPVPSAPCSPQTSLEASTALNAFWNMYQPSSMQDEMNEVTFSNFTPSLRPTPKVGSRLLDSSEGDWGMFQSLKNGSQVVRSAKIVAAPPQQVPVFESMDTQGVARAAKLSPRTVPTARQVGPSIGKEELLEEALRLDARLASLERLAIGVVDVRGPDVLGSDIVLDSSCKLDPSQVPKVPISREPVRDRDFTAVFSIEPLEGYYIDKSRIAEREAYLQSLRMRHACEEYPFFSWLAGVDTSEKDQVLEECSWRSLSQFA